jgi:hypothetical protein
VRVKLFKATKPGKIDMSKELGLNNTRTPDIGPGSLKPNMGRGGVPIPDSMYLGEGDFTVKEKKGIVRNEPSTNTSESKDTKIKWGDIL